LDHVSESESDSDSDGVGDKDEDKDDDDDDADDDDETICQNDNISDRPTERYYGTSSIAGSSLSSSSSSAAAVALAVTAATPMLPTTITITEKIPSGCVDCLVGRSEGLLGQTWQQQRQRQQGFVQQQQ